MNSYFSHSPVKFLLFLRCLVPSFIKIVCCDQCSNWAGSRMNVCHAALKLWSWQVKITHFLLNKWSKRTLNCCLTYSITLIGWLQDWESDKLLLRKWIISNQSSTMAINMLNLKLQVQWLWCHYANNDIKQYINFKNFLKTALDDKLMFKKNINKIYCIINSKCQKYLNVCNRYDKT